MYEKLQIIKFWPLINFCRNCSVSGISNLLSSVATAIAASTAVIPPHGSLTVMISHMTTLHSSIRSRDLTFLVQIYQIFVRKEKLIFMKRISIKLHKNCNYGSLPKRKNVSCRRVISVFYSCAESMYIVIDERVYLPSGAIHLSGPVACCVVDASSLCVSRDMPKSDTCHLSDLCHMSICTCQKLTFGSRYFDNKILRTAKSLSQNKIS